MIKIGDFIKKRRIELGLTQKELAEGLTTQAQISKIEKNESIPLANLLIELANRLRVSLDELLEFEISTCPKEKKLFKREIFEDLLLQRKYSDIYTLTQNIDKNKLEFQDNIYIEWLKLLSSYQMNNTDIREQCQNLLDQIQNTKYIDLKIKILNTLSIYNRNNNLYTDSLKNYEEIFSNLILSTDNAGIFLKVKLNYSNLLRDTEKYQELYEVSLESINLSFLYKEYEFISEFIYNKYYALSQITENKFEYNMEELYFGLYLAKKLKKFEVAKLLNQMK